MPTAAPKELFKSLFKALSSIYDDREARAITKNYLQDRFHLDAIQLAMNTEIAFDQTLFEHDLRRLSNGTPYQHVVGFSYFCGLRFITNRHALIPRPETEELVRWIIDDNPEDGLSVLDIGTGTGCIPIALKAVMKDSDFLGIDVSEEALNLARINANKNNLQVSFSKCDVLQEALPEGKFDIVVSNPPYIPKTDQPDMHQNVLDHEPGLALFVDEKDPLLFYRVIAQKGKAELAEGGRLYFEIHENFGEEMKELLSEEGYSDITLKQDLQDKDRMVRATLEKQL